MHKLIILITVPPDDDIFDLLWPEFLRTAEAMPGLLRETTSRVDFKVYGEVDCRMIHELHFDSLRSLEAAMRSDPGTNAGAVLQRITGGRFTLLFADHHEDGIENLQPGPEAGA
ncbi:MAG TPA: hypothetical protein VMN57_14285 [Anaerolineales bacterium]|nr:hypothetical protein [Anaerolineales bacterium]